MKALIALPCSLTEITIGIAPMGSITAKSTINALKKSRKLNVDNISLKIKTLHKQCTHHCRSAKIIFKTDNANIKQKK